MTTLMVHLKAGRTNTRLLQAAADLSRRLDATIIGIAACQPFQITYGEGYLSGELVEQDTEERERDLKNAESEFRTVLQDNAGLLEWRAALTFMPSADYVAAEARCADLVITAIDHGRSVFDPASRTDIGDLVMKLGRPVIVVPATADPVAFGRVLVAWKDTREARRAVIDALPLLKTADHVAVCEVAAADDIATAQAHVDDVVNWLKRHGVAAERVASLAAGSDAARLDAIACDQAADIIVAGAYGHSRLREWALGGVTRDLLLRPGRCSFVSH